MSGKQQRPPAGAPWVWLTRDLVNSEAWRTLGINERRFIDFLLIEHMTHGGKENGYLLAPRRQLWDFGIGQHFVSDAITEVERRGLVDCKRGIGRRANTYSLTWLPLKDGREPSNRWRSFPPLVSAKQHSLQMSAVSTFNECQTALTKPVVSAKQHSLAPKSSSAKQHSLSRYLTKAKKRGSGEPAAEVPVPDAAPVRLVVQNP